MHPMALETGLVPIHWYGVMMALAFLTGIGTAMCLARRFGKDTTFVSDLGCWVMVSGLIGARLAYVLANFREYMGDPVSILYLQKGGLIYYGGAIGGAVGIALFSRFRHENVWQLLDIMVVPLPLGHALGRVGCFLNGCCSGTLYSGPLAVRYPLDSPPGRAQYDAGLITEPHIEELMRDLTSGRISDTEFQRRISDLVQGGAISPADSCGLPVHPVQLYEAGFNILLYGLLLWYFGRRRTNGSVVGLYLLIYPVIRFCTEFFRGDSRMMVGGLTVAQAESVALFIAGAMMWIWWFRREGSKSDSGA